MHDHFQRFPDTVLNDIREKLFAAHSILISMCKQGYLNILRAQCGYYVFLVCFFKNMNNVKLRHFPVLIFLQRVL